MSYTVATPVTWAFGKLDYSVKLILPDIIYKPLKYIFDYLVKKWFFVGLASFIALSHSYPGATNNVHMDYWAVAIIFFISGLSIPTKELLLNMSNIHAHATVLVTSFLITSSIVFGICCGIKAAGNDEISNWMLAGLIVTHTCPTTVSSNVVMTRQADGNVALCLCEVIIGNMLGAFITPALAQMYLSGSWQFANPANGSSVSTVYRHVMMQIGLSVFVPMFVGQLIQRFFPKETKWCLRVLILNKVGTFMLLLVMWSSFCTAFRQDAFTSVSHSSIIMICFFNVGIYLFFTVFCFFFARPVFILKLFPNKPTAESTTLYKVGYKILRPFYYSKKDTVTILLCGPAKTAALGVSLVTSQYGLDNPHLGQLLVPLVLYQAEQVFTAGLLVPFMKDWINKSKIYDEEGNEIIPISRQLTEFEKDVNNPNIRVNNDSSITSDDKNEIEFAKLSNNIDLENDNINDDGDPLNENYLEEFKTHISHVSNKSI